MFSIVLFFENVAVQQNYLISHSVAQFSKFHSPVICIPTQNLINLFSNYNWQKADTSLKAFHINTRINLKFS